MDRISTLRNVEAALAAFEDGEATLAETERRVRGAVRTYASEFEREERGVYRVGETVVVAASEQEARERAASLADSAADGPVERVE